MSRNSVLFFLCLLIVMINSCGPGKKTTTSVTTPCTNMPITYTADIKSIMETSCSGGSKCHNENKKAGGLALATYQSVKSAANNRRLLCTLKWEAGCPKMPPLSSKLADSEIQKIECWISNGTPE